MGKLLEFGVRNVFSFKESFTFALELNVNYPNSISKGRKTANIMGIKGANASGKTNVLRAFSFIPKGHSVWIAFFLILYGSYRGFAPPG